MEPTRKESEGKPRYEIEVAKQMRAIELLTKFLDNSINKVGAAQRTLSHYETRLKLLEGYWEKFMTLNDILLEYADELSAHSYFSQDLFSFGEMQYTVARSKILDEINLLKGSIVNTETLNQNDVINSSIIPVQPTRQSLPKIVLPKFSGNQSDWENFKELFESMVVSDHHISDIQKLQHLLSCVEGSAAQALKGTKVKPTNFQVAWEKLLRRFDNVKVRLSVHLETLLNLPTVHRKSAADLSLLLDATEEAVKGLEELECPIDQFDVWFVHLVVTRLDRETRESWEISQEKVQGFATYKNLVDFLETRIRSLEQAYGEVSYQQKVKEKGTGRQVSQRKNLSLHNINVQHDKIKFEACGLCSGKHFIRNCERFSKLSVDKRRDLVRKKNLCFNCLSNRHLVSACSSMGRCQVCGEKHCTLLHLDKPAKTDYNVSSHQTTNNLRSDFSQHVDETDQPETKAHTSSLHSRSFNSNDLVLMATARVVLRSPEGSFIKVRALIDPAAERSFISERVASALALKTFRSNVRIKGVGASITAISSAFTQLVLESQHESFSLKFSALILGKLTSLLPNREAAPLEYAHLKGLSLADPEFLKPQRIDCILGADIYPLIIRDGIRRHTPIAQETRLGWILTGMIRDKADDVRVHDQRSDTHSFQVSVYYTQEELSTADALAKFWEVEYIPKKVNLSPDEITCERHFEDTVRRLPCGRYMVRLPFKSKPNLPGSMQRAFSYHTRLEKRLQRDSKLKASYDAFMKEYLELDHMEPVPENEVDDTDVYYLPHHPVFRGNNYSKIRVVFNAAMPSWSGFSLNEFLFTGPKLQQDIVLVLMRWRLFKFVFTCDIVKMFRQISMHPEDRNWLRIIYRFGEEVRHFKFSTVTYGTAVAPYQALRVLRQIAGDHCADSPEIATLLLHQTYVDDIFAGADTIDDLVKMRDKLIEVLLTAQIPLGKWFTNNEHLLKGVTDLGDSEKSVNLTEVVSTLGLKWSTSADEFFFKIEPKPDDRTYVTKRKVLSESSKLFDPMGWLSPMLIKTKIFMQDLWIHGLDWDTPLPPEFFKVWQVICEDLAGLKTIRIPRWFGNVSDDWVLHGFADASKRAYAACIYFVLPNVKSFLICSKVKVAPVKTLSISKLELMAAEQLAKLIEYVLPEFPIQPKTIQCWSDSRNVLCLLKNFPNNKGVFESNRTSAILIALPTVRWRHVKSSDNPADCATRGLSANALREFSLWWAGPSWLPHEKLWPKNLMNLTSNQVVSVLSTNTEVPEANWIMTFSSFSKLARVVDLCRRWLRVLNPGFKSLADSISVLELAEARRKLLQLDQLLHFPAEIDRILKQQNISKSSPLVRLSPFLDQHGLVRVGGRLSNCSFLSYGERHPIILHKSSYLARLIVLDTHKYTLHGGPQLVLSYIIRTFWIIHGKRLIRSILSKCTTCIRFSTKTLSQQMAPLPAIRVTPQRPFHSTGLDYAGPVSVRASKGRGIKSYKGYFAIFICLITKAIHIEIVSDLTTDSFLGALRRFVSRRGLPSIIYSDNGTTFRGADKEIKNLFFRSSAFSKIIVPEVEAKGISWSFIPPHAPHFGGIWEAAVRSFKHHFKRVIGQSLLTFEELSTLAAEIEACLNSRPLCAVSINGQDAVPLTPGHFLVGSELKSLPDSSDITDIDRNYTKRWSLTLAMKNNFWNHWRKEVLHQLMQRNKWYFPKRNLQVGDIVILKEGLTPPIRWPLGKVIETHPSSEGLVRMVTVKTSNSRFLRSVDQLIYLPVDDNAQETYDTMVDSSNDNNVEVRD